ncbi:hypothetical protein H1C71_001824, partial [Ictidomys tridecemlineatus]
PFFLTLFSSSFPSLLLFLSFPSFHFFPFLFIPSRLSFPLILNSLLSFHFPLYLHFPFLLSLLFFLFSSLLSSLSPSHYLSVSSVFLSPFLPRVFSYFSYLVLPPSLSLAFSFSQSIGRIATPNFNSDIS